jgi:glutaconyl-CoA/methylmalonyl-CoA decarboxylase subunit gamma
MKVQVCVGDETFQVEIGDLHTRPIIARVAGEEFAVWPDSGPAGAANVATAAGHSVEPPVLRLVPPAPGRAASAPAGDGSAVRAPIPGVIHEILVREGERVEAGQEICMLEAMKMQNTIRAPHAGRISRIPVAVGQAVKHRDILLEFGD